MLGVKNQSEDAREFQPQHGSICPIPTRVFLTQKEAAAWLSVSSDTFRSFQIPHYELGERCKRWHVDEIAAFVQTRRRDSARTPAIDQQKERQICVSQKERAPRIGGPRGTTRAVSGIAEVLGLPIKS